MTVGGNSYKASVDKGSVSCSKAKSLLRKAVSKSGKSCGTAMKGSCDLGGGWKGRIAYPEESVAAFAYVASSRTPGIPFYKNGHFRKSVALRTSSSRSIASRGYCTTGAQPITHLKNISCSKAVKVALGLLNSGKDYPQCRGQAKKHWRGWKLTPKPSFGGKFGGTKFSKGSKSFLAGNGDTCGTSSSAGRSTAKAKAEKVACDNAKRAVAAQDRAVKQTEGRLKDAKADPRLRGTVPVLKELLSRQNKTLDKYKADQRAKCS